MATVAVVIPTIPGREQLLERALASVKAQRRQPDEVIVEPDPERTGAAHTRNRALARVTADYIAWLDDDDELLPQHVGALMAAVGAADLVYPTPRMVGGKDPTATSVNGTWVLPWGVPFGPEQEQHLRNLGSFIPMTHLVRTELVKKVGGFPIPGTPEWPRPNVEDWGYLIRLLDAGAVFRHLDVVTWRWHVWDGHTGGQPDR